MMGILPVFFNNVFYKCLSAPVLMAGRLNRRE